MCICSYTNETDSIQICKSLGIFEYCIEVDKKNGVTFPSLAKLVNSRTYLDWPQDEAERILFWERLRRNIADVEMVWQSCRQFSDVLLLYYIHVNTGVEWKFNTTITV